MTAINPGDDAALALVDTDRYPIGALETPEGAALLKDSPDMPHRVSRALHRSRRPLV